MTEQKFIEIFHVYEIFRIKEMNLRKAFNKKNVISIESVLTLWTTIAYLFQRWYITSIPKGSTISNPCSQFTSRTEQWLQHTQIPRLLEIKPLDSRILLGILDSSMKLGFWKYATSFHFSRGFQWLRFCFSFSRAKQNSELA